MVLNVFYHLTKIRPAEVVPQPTESTAPHVQLSPTTSVSPTPSATSSTSGEMRTPISRIPIRTANAEKRARLSGDYKPEFDETKLSPSEIRALK